MVRFSSVEGVEDQSLFTVEGLQRPTGTWPIVEFYPQGRATMKAFIFNHDFMVATPDEKCWVRRRQVSRRAGRGK